MAAHQTNLPLEGETIIFNAALECVCGAPFENYGAAYVHIVQVHADELYGSDDGVDHLEDLMNEYISRRS